jgi:hypothetical protein
MIFRRYLPADLADALETLAAAEAPNWWKETLSHPDLHVAIRDGYVSVYAKGQSIFRIERTEAQNGKRELIARMHYKYLLKPKMPRAQQYVAFDGQDFLVSAEPARPPAFIQTSYRAGETLKQLIQAASLYAGPEKEGVHLIASLNPGMIDLEIAFSKEREEEDPTLEKEEVGVEQRRRPRSTAPRIDLTVLHADGRGAARLVFYEAKRFADQRLWGNDAEVLEQLEKYDSFLTSSRPALAQMYADVCAALVRLRREDGKRLAPVVHDVAGGRRRLEIDPVCRLVVFGFNREQKRQLKELSAGLRARLIARGVAKGMILPVDLKPQRRTA